MGELSGSGKSPSSLDSDRNSPVRKTSSEKRNTEVRKIEDFKEEDDGRKTDLEARRSPSSSAPANMR